MMFKQKAKALLFILTFGFTTAVASSEQCKTHDFPTSAIADYVLGCMAANGNSLESLTQCSCSIDLVMDQMSYHDFEQAQTIMQVALDKGNRGLFYREATWAKKRVERLEQIQAESTLTCF